MNQKPLDSMKIAEQFLAEALSSVQLPRDNLFSYHIDELVTDRELSPGEQISVSIDIFKALIVAYGSVSKKYMAMLGIGIEKDTRTLQVETLEDLLTGKLAIAPPPEIYLIARKEPLTPRMAEEHTYPVSQDIIVSETGFVKASFKLSKYRPDVEYARGFIFEHYPLDKQDWEWDW